MSGGITRKGTRLTPFIVQLLQHFRNDLSDRLDRFEVLFRLVVCLLLRADV
jgi:hypothetical protein